MKIENTGLSPNFSRVNIPVEFCVLHYTACDLQRTLEIFLNPASRVAAHFVIDVNGDCFDLGEFMDGPILKGAHAGVSQVAIDGVTYVSLNAVSIGIELVNYNGNIFPYSDEQYSSLNILLAHLGKRFPSLMRPGRILGHENIAGKRGKADPGVLFDWPRFLSSLSLSIQELHSQHSCSLADLEFLKSEINKTSSDKRGSDFWPSLNLLLEERIARRKN
jgi:N-acetylmuramoyl-L-alanine amidase